MNTSPSQCTPVPKGPSYEVTTPLVPWASVKVVSATNVPPTVAGAFATVRVPPPDETALAIMLNSFWSDCWGVPLSCTRIVNVDILGVVGVPLICPVEGLSVNPVGKAPETILHSSAGVPPDDVNVRL